MTSLYQHKTISRVDQNRY